MQHVDQWYRYLTEAEKTATMYTLLQHSSQVQARFFINLLQQMVKRDSLYSLLTPSDSEHPLANAMAKAEQEASQRLMSVLPYKTGARHSFAMGDKDLFGYSLLEDTRRSRRPQSVIEGDSLFVPWRRPTAAVGAIGIERPKSADISQWPGQYSVWSQTSEAESDLNQYRRRVNSQRIPVVPETTEDLVRATNDLSISKEGDTSDEGRRRSTSGKESAKKPADVVDMELLADVPAWLRSLRLHKYNPIFCEMPWQDMVKMSDSELLNKGVAALGARRKMLKVFENVKAHCEANNIEY
ncbi:unnamed protein product [Rhizopus stolonifer]